MHSSKLEKQPASILSGWRLIARPGYPQPSICSFFGGPQLPLCISWRVTMSSLLFKFHLQVTRLQLIVIAIEPNGCLWAIYGMWTSEKLFTFHILVRCSKCPRVSEFMWTRLNPCSYFYSTILHNHWISWYAMPFSVKRRKYCNLNVK